MIYFFIKRCGVYSSTFRFAPCRSDYRFSDTKVRIYNDPAKQFNICLCVINRPPGVFIIMTQEELENNYTYKIIRKVLMREYPWIKDVQLDVPGLEKFEYALFLDIYINPYELGEERGYNVARWIESAIRNKEDYYTSVITMYFDGSSEEMRAITTEVNDTITSTQNSPAIPVDLRLPSDKRFMVGSYHLADDITIPILPVEDDTLT